MLTLPSFRVVAGVDEAGRGPLAGPVFAAAVVLDPARPVQGVRDSKLLGTAAREAFAATIRERAFAWAVASADAAEIDSLDILRATLLAMKRAIDALPLVPDEVLVDGTRCPELSCPSRAIVDGDRHVAAISAASILAKTARDALLLELDRVYPQYGFAQHKGYGTPEHLAALNRYGPCPIHRRSFTRVLQIELDF